MRYFLVLLFLSCCGWDGSHAFRRTPQQSSSSSSSSTQQQQQQQERRRTARTSTPLNVPVPQHPDEHLVHDLPLFDDNDKLQHWAGHLPIQEGDKYLFYWLFAPPASTAAAAGAGGANNNNNDAPLIIWLNGGPACSSMDGLFLENGPLQWTTADDGTYRLQRNPYSWHTAPAYTLYIDQPVGTGLSFTTSGTYPRNDQQVNTDFYAFLQAFFRLHADKFVNNNNDDDDDNNGSSGNGAVVHRDVYFSGESHAGHYIPSMMHWILQQNDRIRRGGTTNTASSSSSNMMMIEIPLAGAAIGNGWIDPYHQYAAAAAAYGHGLIDLAQLYQLDDNEIKCQAALDRQQYTAGVCFDLLDNVVGQSYGSNSPYKVSQYDVRRSEPRHGERNFPPGYKVTEAYLGGSPLTGKEEHNKIDAAIFSNVLTALHATAATQAGQRYQECTDPPYNALAHQDGLGVVDDVVAVLNHASQPRMLFFNGIQDLICNHVGNEKALENLPWPYQAEWMKASRYAWVGPNDNNNNSNNNRNENDKDALPVAGYMREFRNLMYLKLFNAGHMVPLDQPAVALSMMQTLLHGGSFDSSRQALTSAVHPPNEASCPQCPVCPASSNDKDDCPICPTSSGMSVNGDDDDDDDPSDDDSIWTWLGPLLTVTGVLALAYACWPTRRRGRGRGKVVDRDGDLDLSPMNGSNGVSSSSSGRAALELHERQSSYHDDVSLEEHELS